MNQRQILPTDKTYSNSLKDPVRIRPVELDSFPPRTVPDLFDEACMQNRSKVALSYKKDGIWENITYRDYRAMVRCCAKGFIALGLQPNTVVCIMGFNSPEWFISDLGAIYAGGVACGIYTTNSPEACLYCINKSKARIVVAESIQIRKILQIKGEANSIKAIIQYDGEPDDASVYSWDKFMRIGEKVSDSRLESAKRGMKVNQCCTLIYTSGTTGNPKGVMLSHDNFTYSALKTCDMLSVSKAGDEIYVSYLPLSHVIGNIIDIHLCFIIGARVFFAERDALRGSLLNTLQEVKPTRLLSVPRVWEKIYEKLQEKAAETKGIKRIIAKWAKNQGLKKHLAIEKNETYSGMYYIANFVFLKKVKKILGVQHCRSIYCGAAPLSPEIKLYFASLDILILEGFGMSESAGMHCCCLPKSFRFESCGKTCKGYVSYISNPDEEGNGELNLYGRHIFMGYLEDEEKTLESLDICGNLHSGDIARIDDDGFVYISGRLKELIITAGGENVAPVLIEQNIKSALPFIGYAVVIGDRRKFLIVLLTLSAEVDENQRPTDVLTMNVRNWLSTLGLSYKTTGEVLRSGPDKKILDSIQEGLDEANEKAISSAQKVQKFAILPQDFSVATGELGPTMKVKRKNVSEKYEDIINDIYEKAIAPGQ